MPGGWQPTGQWIMRFRKALDAAFDEPSIELLTVDYFWPSIFSKVSATNKTFEIRLQELITRALMEDWLPDLVAAARERRPRNADIAEIAEELGLTIIGPRLDNPTGRTLEAMVQEHARFITPSSFRERLAFLEGQVCWIDVPHGGGTGFLVGADLVLTNQHVIDPIDKGLVNWRDVTCLFDYRETVEGGKLGKKKGTTVRLADTWLVDSSPPSDHDGEPALGDATDEELDFALIRLADRIGDLPLGGPATDPLAEPRNWITVAEPTPALAAGNQVFLLQHPLGEPLQLAVGQVTAFNPSGTRVRHDANSKRGSSGSPCFDADLQLVALHHAGDPVYPPTWNQAVPITSILHDWRDGGVVVP